MPSTEIAAGSQPKSESDGASWSRVTVLALGLLIVVATVALHWRTLRYPMLITDDFQLVADSWPGHVLRANLWLPHNEHVMPSGRVLTFLLVELAGSATALPWVLGMVGAVAVLLAQGVIYLLVRRELGHPFYGLLAMGLFGLTSHYAETVYWYAASYFLLAFLFTLLALLMAQRWVQKRSVTALFGCVFFTATAPTWNAIGILAGPLSALYLFLPAGIPDSTRTTILRRSGLAFVPLLGCALFLGVSLPMTAEKLLHVPHYGDKSTLESFKPDVGAVYTLRSIVDNFVFRSVGLMHRAPAPTLTYYLFAAVAAVGAIWFYFSRHRRILIVGLAFILLNYLLIYSARAGWKYERICVWGRYHVFPICGLVLFFVGGLTRWEEQWLRRPSRFCARAIWAWLVVMVAAFLIHASDTWSGWHDAKQAQELRAIDAMDRRCREHHVSRDQALRVLPPLFILGSGKLKNCWQLMRCSDTPRNVSDLEAEQLLIGRSE